MMSTQIASAYESLGRALTPGGAATELGFRGFEGGSVVDIGSGDGRYSDISLELGAISLTCIEHSAAALARMKVEGNCIGAAVLAGDAVAASRLPDYGASFDVATLFNIAPHHSDSLLAAGTRMLRQTGELVVTTTEIGLLSRVAEIEQILSQEFARVETAKLYAGSQPRCANNFLTIATGRIT